MYFIRADGEICKNRGTRFMVSAIKLSRVSTNNDCDGSRRFSAISRQIYANFPAVTGTFCSQVQSQQWRRPAVTGSTRIYEDPVSSSNHRRGWNFQIRAEPGLTVPRREVRRPTSIGRPRTDIRWTTYRAYEGCSGTARWSFCRFRRPRSARMCTARLTDASRAIQSAEFSAVTCRSEQVR